MSKLARIDQEWQEFRDHVISPEAGKHQLEEMELAFKAGAYAYHSIVNQIACPRISEDEGVQIIAEIDRELMAFYKAMVKRMKGKR